MLKGNKKSILHYLPVFGCFATGTIYVAIGIIAILSFLRLKQGGADEGSLLAFLDDYLAGKVFIFLILLGLVSYVIWRFYESFTDPYEYGNSPKGIGLRIGIALSTIPDALIAYSALMVLLGNSNVGEHGQPDEERELVSFMFRESWGDWLIVAVGFIIVVTGLIQFIYGITKGYKERLNIHFFGSRIKRLIHVLAWVGYLARGIILGIIGFFFIKAGFSENAQYIVNTDKAFDFIGDHVGHVYFILVAAGTICYGLFMFGHGIAYDVDKD